MLDFLKLMGLNEAEAKLYQALFTLKKASLSQLAGHLRKSKGYTRYRLDELLKKQLISLKKEEGTRYYQPQSPTKLIALLQAEKCKEQDMFRQGCEGLLHSIYPQISKLQPQFHANVDEALKAYETFFELLPNDTTLLNLVHAVDDREYEARQKIIDWCVQKRREKNIEIKCLATFQPNTVRLQLKDFSTNRETRIFDADYPFPFELMVHPKAFFVMTRIQGQILSLLLYDSPFTQLMNQVFTNLWEQSAPRLSQSNQREKKGY